jgi:hypothetical protein
LFALHRTPSVPPIAGACPTQKEPFAPESVCARLHERPSPHVAPEAHGVTHAFWKHFDPGCTFSHAASVHVVSQPPFAFVPGHEVEHPENAATMPSKIGTRRARDTKGGADGEGGRGTRGSVT